MAKKLFLVSLFAFVFCLSLFAESYIIRSYDFDISGKTQKWVVENLIVPKDEEKFSTWEEVESALNNKQQALLNKRVFKSVEYSYTVESLDDVGYVDVKFDIVDARTVLVLPYPKYDSNYGLRIGLKYWNSNVLGTFSSMSGTVHDTFEPGNYEESAKYFADFTLKDLLIGKTSISAEFTGNATQKEGVSNYNASLSVSNIVIASRYSLNFSLGFKNSGSEFIYSASSSFGGLKVGSVGFSPSISTAIYEKSKGSSYIQPALSTSGVKIGIVNLGFYDYVKFMNSEKFDVNHYYHSMSMSFSEGKLSSCSYSHSFTYYPKSSLLFNNTVSYKLSSATTILFYENLKWKNEDFEFDYFDTGVGIKQTIHIGEHVTLTPTLSQYLRTTLNGDEDPSFQPYYCLSASSSGNYINWKGNFREGVSYSFSISESWYQNYVSRTPRGSYSDKFEIQVHKIFGNWFNPSVRILGSYTNNIGSYGSATGTSSGDFGEYLRGVRNQTVKDDGRNRNLLSLVVNVNLMTVFPLPTFMSSWMDAYLNVFCDYAFTKHGVDTTDANVKRHYLSFGFEGLGILKEYPSYPVRASLGFDARKLLEYIKGESGSKDFYELYIGLDFFF